MRIMVVFLMAALVGCGGGQFSSTGEQAPDTGVSTSDGGDQGDALPSPEAATEAGCVGCTDADADPPSEGGQPEATTGVDSSTPHDGGNAGCATYSGNAVLLCGDTISQAVSCPVNSNPSQSDLLCRSVTSSSPSVSLFCCKPWFPAADAGPPCTSYPAACASISKPWIGFACPTGSSPYQQDPRDFPGCVNPIPPYGQASDFFCCN